MEMFKSILFFAFVSMVWARPSYLHTSVLPYELDFEPTVVGHTIHSYPTAVSHQSQTIVHEKRPYLRPIIEHAPILKAYTAPAVSVLSPYYDGWGGAYNGYKSSGYGGWNHW